MILYSRYIDTVEISLSVEGNFRGHNSKVEFGKGRLHCCREWSILFENEPEIHFEAIHSFALIRKTFPEVPVPDQPLTHPPDKSPKETTWHQGQRDHLQGEHQGQDPGESPLLVMKRKASKFC